MEIATMGIVIPTFNRLTNLQKILYSLEKQIFLNFYVLISDDGSSDGTKEYIENLKLNVFWKQRIEWISVKRKFTGQRALVRNIGVKKLPKNIENILLLDSDILLNKKTLNMFNFLLDNDANKIIFGMVEWLPPLDEELLNNQLLNEDFFNILKKYILSEKSQRVKGTYVGPELRKKELFMNNSVYDVDGRWALFNNTFMKRETFNKIGGFDENMMGYGYEDMEFGIRCQHMDIKCIYSSEAQGLHIWHPKESSSLMNLENQKNLNYILIKHGWDNYYVQDIDWSIWWHYKLVLGGQVFLSTDDKFWAINKQKTHKLYLPNFNWLIKLGKKSNIEKISINELEKYTFAGEAKDEKIRIEVED